MTGLQPPLQQPRANVRGNVPTFPRAGTGCADKVKEEVSLCYEEKASLIFSHTNRPTWKLFLDKWKQVNPHLSVTLAKQGMSSNLI